MNNQLADNQLISDQLISDQSDQSIVQQSTNDQLVNQDEIPLFDESSNFNTFSAGQMDNAMLNRYILENNNLNQQVNAQTYEQFIQQNRSKVYLFKPKQILDPATVDTSQTNFELHQNHLTLPTKSTLSKSFPKLYKQLYQPDQPHPLQRNVQQFFRSNVDAASGDLQSDDPTRPGNAEKIEISTKTIKAVPLGEAYADDVRTISPSIFESKASYDKTPGDESGNKSGLIRSASSDKNESLIKSAMLIRNQTSSIQIDSLPDVTNKSSSSSSTKKRMLTYKDFKYLSPIEFKVMKIDKSKFNRYVPKIVYSKTKKKNKRKTTDNLNSNSNGNQNNNQNNNQNENQNENSNERGFESLKLIPVSYVVDDLTNQDYYATPDLYSNNALSLFYNLNSVDLIGTLIDNLINGSPTNVLNLYPDLVRNLPELLLNNGLFLTNVDKRSGKRSLTDRKRIEELKKEKTNQIRQLLGVMQLKELADQLKQKSTNRDLNSKLIELLKQNDKVKKLLLNGQLDAKKLDSNSKEIYEKEQSKPKCLDLNNSTICFTKLESVD